MGHQRSRWMERLLRPPIRGCCNLPFGKNSFPSSGWMVKDMHEKEREAATQIFPKKNSRASPKPRSTSQPPTGRRLINCRPIHRPAARRRRSSLPGRGRRRARGRRAAGLQADRQHVRPSTGRFFGYVAGSGEPVGAIGELLAAALNQNVTAWRSAPAAVTIERAVVGWLAEAVGCAGFTGSLCGGGSAANLMGLAMAREAKLPANETGVGGGVVYASEQVHMSIPKAVAHARHRQEQSAAHPRRRTVPDAARRARGSDCRRPQAGRKPIAIVATVGTVVTGAIDPLREIAAIARSEDLWLHVDGAYGVPAALAVPERLEGLALADSLSLDAHKWLYQPIDCGCLLYRDAQAARNAFSNSDDYVRIFSEDPAEAFAFFEESFELSRRFRALKLWMSLQYHGRRAYREAILRDLAHAQLLAETIRVAARAGTAGAGDAERGLLPPSQQRQPGNPQASDCTGPGVSVERDDTRPVRAKGVFRQSPHHGRRRSGDRLGGDRGGRRGQCVIVATAIDPSELSVDSPRTAAGRTKAGDQT